MSRKLIFSILLLLTATSSTWASGEEDSTLVYRPAYHFTTQQNAMGAPVGIISDGGIYHLFYEYNPNGLASENYSLGHATSTNLIQWKEQTLAFSPEEKGIQGASCLADERNTLGKQEGNQATFIMAYGVEGKGIKMAYSTNAGKSWQVLSSSVELACDASEYARDPKLMWHEDSQSYILMVSRTPDADADAYGISFYHSTDLKSWTFSSHIRGLNGNPDLYQLPINGDKEQMQWVLSDDQGNYMLGDFNGKSFSARTALQENQTGKFNSPCSFLDKKGQRVIQIASISQNHISGTTYNGVMSIPMQLGLVKTDDNPTVLTKQPLKEMSTLSSRLVLNLRNRKLIPGINDNPIQRLSGVSTYINAQFNTNNVDAFGFLVLNSRKEEGSELLYNAKKGSLSWMNASLPIKLKDKRMQVELWVDKSTVEIFINGGELVISSQIEPTIGNEKYVLAAQGGELIIESLNAHKLKKNRP